MRLRPSVCVYEVILYRTLNRVSANIHTRVITHSVYHNTQITNPYAVLKLVLAGQKWSFCREQDERGFASLRDKR